MKILVVEDTEDSRILLTDFLVSHDYEVIAVNNGAEALQSLQNDRPDLIISDILMPEVDGYELCRKIKTDTALKNIPFIFYTATYTQERDRQLALSLGADYFMIKPQTPDDLLMNIEKVLAGETMKSGHTVDDEEFSAAHGVVVTKKLEKKIVELRAERELLNRKERELRLVTDSVPMLIAHIGRDLCYLYANKTYESWHNMRRSEIVGHTVREVVGDEAWHIVEPYIRKALDGDFVEFETELTFKAGTNRHIYARYIPDINAAGEVEGFVALVNDITQRVKEQNEKAHLQHQLLQVQKMESIGQLAGGIAHDFNNILTSMLGFTELALDMNKGGNETLLAYLKEVLNAGNKARDLVQQLLVFSRGGTQEIQTVNVTTQIRDAMRLISILLPSSISVEFAQSDRDYHIQINSVHFQQIIMNLCINARDAMSNRGRILITIKMQSLHGKNCSACHMPIDGQYVVLSIEDTGSGMSTEVQERIFEPFFSTKQLGSGTGMGLSVVHGIVHDMGGHILLHSAPGKGTEFSLLFPEATEKVVAGKDSRTSAAESALQRKVRILVVDDEVSVGHYLGELLSNHGYETEIFTSAAEALARFRESADSFDLVLTDYKMPNMNGSELAGEIHKLDQNIPIILCTGYNEDVTGKLIGQQGIISSFSKPFTAYKLLDKLQELLG